MFSEFSKHTGSTVESSSKTASSGNGRVDRRYDDAHELSKNHERHTLDSVEEIDVPGVVALYDRFVREYDELRGIGPQ